MKTAVIRPESEASLSLEQAEGIRSAVESSHARETVRTYASAWESFSSYCAAVGWNAMPADPVHVAAYLVDRAKTGRSLSSIKHSRAAIAHAHKEAGMPDPCSNEGVRRVLRGLSRQAAEAGRVSKQAAALTAEALSAIRATATKPRTGPTGRTESAKAAERRGCVDVALCSLMRDALLRRSECAALQWTDIEFHANGTGRLHIRRSKTDQEGTGNVQFLSRETVRALRKIMLSEPEGSVFGLCAASIQNRITSAARVAGLSGRFTGHSCRVGMARDLAANGTELPALMQAGRWQSERMPAVYTRNESAGRGAVARYYGDS